MLQLTTQQGAVLEQFGAELHFANSVTNPPEKRVACFVKDKASNQFYKDPFYGMEEQSAANAAIAGIPAADKPLTRAQSLTLENDAANAKVAALTDEVALLRAKLEAATKQKEPPAFDPLTADFPALRAKAAELDIPVPSTISKKTLADTIAAKLAASSAAAAQ